jgi:hypothetical protein
VISQASRTSIKERNAISSASFMAAALCSPSILWSIGNNSISVGSGKNIYLVVAIKKEAGIWMIGRGGVFMLAGITTAAGMSPAIQVLSGDVAHKLKKGLYEFERGIAWYTFRSFTLDQTINTTKGLGLKKLSLKDKHVTLNSSERKIREATGAIIQSSGLDLDSCGVVYIEERRRSDTGSLLCSNVRN